MRDQPADAAGPGAADRSRIWPDILRRRPLRRRRRWLVEDPPEAVMSRVRELVAPVPEGFTLYSRLSGAGIVVRTIRPPEGVDRPMFGMVDQSGFRVALVPDPTHVSPFSPLIRAWVSEAEGGSMIETELEPHPGARSFEVVYAVAAVLLVVATMVKGLENPAFAVVGYALAALLLVFPQYRARVGFAHACAHAEARLASLLALSPEDSPPVDG